MRSESTLDIDLHYVTKSIEDVVQQHKVTMKKPLLLNSLVVITLLLCSGCASVVSLATGPRPKIHLNSTPPGATVTIMSEDGKTVVTTNTPAVVRLSRKQGYFSGQDYNVKFELAGYNPAETQIRAQLNPWYIGNVLVGGIIGLAVVDPLTGAMWSLSPNKLERNLVPLSQSQGQAPVPKPAAAASPGTPPKS